MKNRILENTDRANACTRHQPLLEIVDFQMSPNPQYAVSGARLRRSLKVSEGIFTFSGNNRRFIIIIV